MNSGTIYALVNRTGDNEVYVTNFNCDEGKIRMDIRHRETQRQIAQLDPAQARIIADALIKCADELEGK